MRPRRLGWFVLVAVLAIPGAGHAGLRETAHNLSPAGLGRRQTVGPGVMAPAPAEGETDMCVFCHTPHSAKAQRGMWSRKLEPVRYKLYESSTTEARIQQPNGSSRLCLSCHDGMMATGATPRQSATTSATLSGSSVLGTDLSDDHPISFVYDQSLLARRRDLANPAALTGGIKLDPSGQVQCTSCHDAHIDRHPKFLVADPAYSGICVTCHRLSNWPESTHATSSATARAGSPLPGLGYATVGENGCSICHRSHGAQHPQRLLTAATEEGVCFACHDGRAAAKDVRRESLKFSAHRVDLYTDVHDPTENPDLMPRHVECVDCHNSHAVRANSVAGQISGPLTGVSGISISGTSVREATFEYEVCLKCHGVSEDRNPVVFRSGTNPDPVVSRTDGPTNVRLKIDPQNPSFHPVADIGRNAEIRGLIAPLTATSRTSCTACHNNDAVSFGGSNAPRGPHGSNFRPILAAEYHLEGTVQRESYQLYALCYGCHDRNSLLNRRDGFPHRSHVVEDGASCAVCHDAHGSRDNKYLINFMRRDVTGNNVVTPASSGQLDYASLGAGVGRCSLTCHGVDHNPKEYPPSRAQPGAALPGPRQRNHGR